MKKELKSYSIIFMKKEENPILLSISEGESLKKALANGDTFIELTTRNLMIRANTIDRIVGNYRNLEEKCMICHQLKPLNGKCPRDCENPNLENLERINEIKAKIGSGFKFTKIDEEDPLETNCKACDVLTNNGSYCIECEPIYAL